MFFCNYFSEFQPTSTFWEDVSIANGNDLNVKVALMVAVNMMLQKITQDWKFVDAIEYDLVYV
jgi:hypothetical protein